MASSMAVTAVTVIGSVLSTIGSGFVLICYSILPLEQHFRHVLIFNLALSDFLNSLNNTVAGIYILARRRGLDGGRGCTFNGFVGQVTVQATDCAILAIAIATLWVIVRRESSVSAAQWRSWKVAVVSLTIWALPFFTGLLALGMHWYAPASGNWCWIKTNPPYLRYVLTHGWRFLFVLIEVGLYVYLDIHLRRHYNTVSTSLPRDVGRNPRLCDLNAVVDENALIHSPSSATSCNPPNLDRIIAIDGCDVGLKPTSSSATLSPSASRNVPSLLAPPNSPSSWSLIRVAGLRSTQKASNANATSPQYQAIQRVLLLNAYPLAYIILWIPGLVNRLIEATGRTSTIAQFFQSSTQFVGLANALTYGWNESVAMRFRERCLPRRYGEHTV
ncbi:hypothetical protein M378DRAFT_172311 [Amanita muscaria Koide BX008]|uniref:Glucose receptor Git3-like N-terminal domain-containing protein n=1 Tax=Amanita muscaria (strain Koide BX008) TaxID=946122 RepID=A0A0C2W6X9_AMAMK|nr:hypothetical protein M378DRAFT_172311 [Amanita muscaria Koide BX008]